MKTTARSVEPGLRRQHAVVDLAPEARRAGLDAQPLELVCADTLAVERRVEHLPRLAPELRVRDRVVRSLAEDERRRVLLELDLRLRREAHAHELAAHALAELGLGQQQEVVVPRGAGREAARSRAPSP